MRQSFKKLAVFLLVLLLTLTPGRVFALENGDLDVWQSGRPAGYALYVKNADWSLEGNAVRLTVDEKGFALLSQELALEADSCYVLSAKVLAENVAGGPPGVHLGIDGQLAATEPLYDTGGEWVALTLNLRTNKDASQTYVFRVGMGAENDQCTGTMYVGHITLEKVEKFAEGTSSFTLVGSLSTDQDFSPILISSGTIERKDRIAHEREGISYDHLGAALFATLLCAAFYLAFTGKWAGRLARFAGGRWVFYGLFAAAALLRIYITFKYSGYTDDMSALKNAAISAYENGLPAFYASAAFSAYPPLYALLLYVAGALRSIFSLSLDSAAFGLLLRCPAIFADLLLALLLYKITARKLNKSTAVLMAGMALFVPVFLFDSGLIAGKGSLFALLSFLAVSYLDQKKRVASAVLLTLAFLVNVWALALVPLYLFVLVRDVLKESGGKKVLLQALYMLLASAAAYILISLPFLKGNSIFYVFQNCVGGYAPGKFFTFNIVSLTGNNLVIAGILGALSLLAACVFYCKTKDVFLTASALAMGVLTFTFAEAENCILAAALLLATAAVRNSRRLLLSALAVCSAGLLNLYGIYAYGPAQVPFSMQFVLALLSMAAFFYYAFAVLQSRRADGLKVEPVERMSFHRRACQAAEARLAEPTQKEKLIGRWDVLLMLLITAVYAVVAFVNLGSTNIPEEGTVFQDGESAVAVIELAEPAEVGQLKYYTGYCQGTFRVYYSLDGEGYTEVSQGLVNHQYRLMFRWEMVDIWDEIKYVKLVYSSGTLELREVGVFDQQNHRLPVKSASLTLKGEAADADYLIDEQNEVPETTDYMTEMYFDEIYHARTAYEYMHGIYPYEITHPPLGKSIITLGIRLFGFNPFGWRFMGTLFGVLMLPVIYLFAKMLLKKRVFAAAAAIFFAADFMHFSLTRIATIDSYSIFFILLMYLFMYRYTQHNFNREPLVKGLLPLALSGVFFALGAATKWICIYAGGGLAILFFQSVYSRYQEYLYAKEAGLGDVCSLYKKKLWTTLLFCVVVFILIPVFVYCLSYIPYELTPGSFGLKGILENQKYMLSYHGKLATEKLHSYQSGVYTWPFTIRPVFFFRADGTPEGYAGVLWCMGNPLIWIGGLLSILYLIGIRKSGEGSLKFKGLPFISVAALMGYLPWMLVTREVFIYHYFAVVPFLILITLYAFRHLIENYPWGRKAFYAYVALAVILFAAFYPANTGMLASKDWLYLIQWYPTWPI